jgi:antitoxin component YwqK of YwqJK toxin-antitoxin module
MRGVVICLYLFLNFLTGYTQDNRPLFFKIFHDDSVALFFNRNLFFTGEDCLDYKRNIRVTESGDFNGYFEDRGTDNVMIGKGQYANGIKHGYFEIFYSNGNTYCKGYYENNKPIGIWEFFYATGLPERTLKLTGSDTLLVRFIDINNKVRVQDGIGKFTGGNIAGKVVDGKPHGKWSALGYNMSPFYVEIYDHGTLIKKRGRINGMLRTKDKTPLLTTFFPENYFPVLEQFGMQFCTDFKPFAFGNNSNEYFILELRYLIDRQVQQDLRFGNGKYYTIGDAYLGVQFLVDENGKAHDFTIIEGSNNNLKSVLYETVKNTISKSTFKKREMTMTFHFKFSYAGGLNYRYSLRFSKRKKKATY